MNRRERREYKRWLDKNELWDSFFVDCWDKVDYKD